MYYSELNVIRHNLDEHYARILYRGELTIHGHNKLYMFKWKKNHQQCILLLRLICF